MSLYKEIIDQQIKLFSFTRVPENIPTPEVLISSLIRELKISKLNISETKAWSFSQELKAKLRDKNRVFSEISFNKWSYIYENYTASIRSKDQTNNRDDYFYFNPIVPAFAQFGHAARFKGNPWNPGGLLLEEMYLAFSNNIDWNNFQRKIHKSLEVDENDDLWSRFLQLKTTELSNIFFPSIELNDDFNDISSNYKFSGKFLERCSLTAAHPAINKVFVKYLEMLLDLKDKFSRHRWISILQSYLRFSTFLLVLNKLTYSVNLVDLLINKKNYDINAIFRTTEVKLGDKRKELIEDRIVGYLYSNLQLSLLANLDVLNSNVDLNSMFNHISNRIESNQIDFATANSESMDYLHGKYKEDFRLTQNDTIKNIREFLEYVGRDRSVNNKSVNGDIGYIYTIPPNSKSYVVEFGLGLTYTLVLLAGQSHSKNNDTLSANEFISFLSEFGIILTSKDFNEGPLRNSLNDLGLLLESPDSELGVSIKKII
jgi:hypothetical protein